MSLHSISKTRRRLAEEHKSLMLDRQRIIANFQHNWNQHWIGPLNSFPWKETEVCKDLQASLVVLRDAIRVNRERSIFYKKLFKQRQRK